MRTIIFVALTTLATMFTASAQNAFAPLSLLELTASDGRRGAQLGATVAISGNTAVVSGSCNQNGPDPNCDTNGGSAYVFQRSSSTGWSDATQVAELTPSDSTVFSGFGWSVSIDGDTVVAGAPYENAAYVFVKPPAGWSNMTETAKLTIGQSSFAGSSVAVSGNTVVMGANSTGNGGAAYVFVRNSSVWQSTSEPNAELTASNPTQESYLGTSVSIEADTIVAGATDTYLSSPGAAYLFVRPQGGWVSSTETAILTPSVDTEDAWFGFSTSVAGDTVAVGAFRDMVTGNLGQGAAYIFVRPASGWTDATETARLAVSDGRTNDQFGWSIALTENNVVVGADNAFNGQGTAYVFAKPVSGWSSTSVPTAKFRTQAAKFLGFSVAAEGGTFVIGAPFSTVNSNPLQGAAFVTGK